MAKFIRFEEEEEEPKFRIPPILEDAAYLRDWMHHNPSELTVRVAKALTERSGEPLISATAAILRGLVKAYDLAGTGRPSLIEHITIDTESGNSACRAYSRALEVFGFKGIRTDQYDTLGVKVIENDLTSPYFTGPDQQVVVSELLQDGKDLYIFAEVGLAGPITQPE